MCGDRPQASLELLDTLGKLRGSARRMDIGISATPERETHVLRGRVRQQRKDEARVVERGQAPRRCGQDLRLSRAAVGQVMHRIDQRRPRFCR